MELRDTVFSERPGVASAFVHAPGAFAYAVEFLPPTTVLVDV